MSLCLFDLHLRLLDCIKVVHDVYIYCICVILYPQNESWKEVFTKLKLVETLICCPLFDTCFMTKHGTYSCKMTPIETTWCLTVDQ